MLGFCGIGLSVILLILNYIFQTYIFHFSFVYNGSNDMEHINTYIARPIEHK